MTLTCRSVGSTAQVSVCSGSSGDTVPPGRRKVRNAVSVYRLMHDIPADTSINVRITSSIPMGIGMGSSTADIVATLRALDQAYGNSTCLEDLVGMVLKVEDACDSTMLDHRVRLFAQRDGIVAKDFGKRLPPFYVLGFNLMPEESFETDETPPAEYTEAEVEQFDTLLASLRSAIDLGDCRRIAEIATASAMINQGKFPKRHFEQLLKVGRTMKAAGICVSHSGTIAGLIFPIDALPPDAVLETGSKNVEGWGCANLGLYRM